MSIFTVNLIEHYPRFGALSDLAKGAGAGGGGDLAKGAGGAGGAGKIDPPSARARGIEYDNARRLENPVPPKKTVPPPVPPKKTNPVPPKKTNPVPPKKTNPVPPKAPEPLVASPKVIEDLKTYEKDLFQRLQNTLNAMEKAKTAGKLDDLGEFGKVAKQIDEGGSAIPKMADGSSMVKGKVEADEIVSNLKKLEVDPPKDIDDAAVKIKKTSEDRLKELAQEIEKNPTIKKTVDWVNNHKLLVGGVVLGATIAGGMAIGAAIQEKEKTDAIYNIISIDDISTSSLPLAKITFTPSVKLSKRDSLMFSGTNCNPPLPPQCEIYQIDSDFQVQVIIREKLTSNGTSGTMKIKTSFGNQFSLLLTGSVNEVASIGGETAGAIAEGAGIVTAEVAGSFWEGLGLPDLTSYWWIILIITLVILSSSSSLAFAFIQR
jgi:hypothetical protein